MKRRGLPSQFEGHEQCFPTKPPNSYIIQLTTILSLSTLWHYQPRIEQRSASPPTIPKLTVIRALYPLHIYYVHAAYSFRERRSMTERIIATTTNSFISPMGRMHIRTPGRYKVRGETTSIIVWINRQNFTSTR